MFIDYKVCLILFYRVSLFHYCFSIFITGATFYDLSDPELNSDATQAIFKIVMVGMSRDLYHFVPLLGRNSLVPGSLRRAPFGLVELRPAGNWKLCALTGSGSPLAPSRMMHFHQLPFKLTFISFWDYASVQLYSRSFKGVRNGFSVHQWLQLQDSD